MFIILLAHIPGNWWALWIPARFGFSDGAEIFVFCSGMASALAFGALFTTHGFAMGAARVAFRIWQIYWAHICMFLATLLLLLVANELTDVRDYVGRLNLYPFLNDTGSNMIGLLTLTYVPNYFDMLPMYVGVLFMLPVVAMLGWFDPRAAGAFVFFVWLAATTGLINMPAEPWSEREWFFNPFGWQLVFFTGFAFAMGWIRPPPIERKGVLIALVVVLISLPFAYYRIYREFEDLLAIRNEIRPLWTKTDYGLFRYVHFLAVAYLGWCAVGEGGRRLFAKGLWGRIVDIVRMVGQQSLAVFVTSMVLAQALGMIWDQIGKTHITVMAVNLFGFVCLIATAWTVRWFKSQPWRKPPAE